MCQLVADDACQLLIVQNAARTPAGVELRAGKVEAVADLMRDDPAVDPQQLLLRGLGAVALRGRKARAIRNAKFSDPIVKDDKAIVLRTYETYDFVNLEKIDGKWKVTGTGQAQDLEK